MFHISLFENGKFCTHIGGDVRTVAEASRQVERAMAGISGEKIDGFIGFRFDRNGTSCAVIVTDDFDGLVRELTLNNN